MKYINRIPTGPFLVALMAVVLGRVGEPLMSLTCVVASLALLYRARWLPSGLSNFIEVVIAYVILSSTFTFVALEFVPSSVASTMATVLAIIVYLALFLLGSNINLSHEEKRMSVIAPVLIIFLIVLTLNIDTAVKINFLGLGYDSYGHLFQARSIANEAHSFLTTTSDHITLIATNTPQGLASGIATLLRVMGSPQNLSSALTLQTLVVVGMPLTIVVLWSKSILMSLRARHTSYALFGLTVIGLSFLYGHFSRIWFSGYVASNLATLYFIVCLSNVAKTSAVGFVRNITRITVLGHLWPPMAAILGLVIVVMKVMKLGSIRSTKTLVTYCSYRSRWKQFTNTYGLRQTLTIGLPSVLLVGSLYFPYEAITRSFSVEHISVGGGIEAPRFFPYIMSVVILAFVPAVFSFGLQQRAIVSTGLVGASVLTLSWLKYHAVPYYPAKIIMALVTAQLTLFLVTFSKDRAQWAKRSFVGGHLTGLAIFFLMQVSAYPVSAMTYTYGYMGRPVEVAKSMINGRDEYVDGQAILTTTSRNYEAGTIVLYLSDKFESELNTRWINSLTFNWNDRAWGEWIQLRAFIDEEKFMEADDLIAASSIRVVIRDSYKGLMPGVLGTLLPDASEKQLVCFFDSTTVDKC
jgi:hypothetical protein